MITVRKSKERGFADHGWLRSFHTFSFADYFDPNNMAFSVLRVINEDTVAGATGFPTHPHKDMEIITYVISGALEHKDTLGTTAVIRPGEVQRMTAGTGIRHSEFNHSKDEDVHLLQIWVLPLEAGLKPGYEQKSFLEKMEKSNFVLIVSQDGRQGSVLIHQDVSLFVGRFRPGDQKNIDLNGRKAWIQIVKGQLKINGETLNAGDGAAVEKETSVHMGAQDESEFLFFNLP